MKKAGLLAIIACLLCSYTRHSYSIKTVIDHHFLALNKHDVNELVKDYADGATMLSPSCDDVKKAPEQVISAYTRYFHTSPDLKYTITNVIYTDSYATVEYESVGTMISPEAGTPAYMNKKKYTLKNCAVYKFKDGKIVYESVYFDQVAFLKQVGFFDQPAPGK